MLVMPKRYLGLCLLLGAYACAEDGLDDPPEAVREAATQPQGSTGGEAREAVDLPPLPEGEINAGDDDGDHIRDTIEDYLAETYGNDELKHLSARQAARALQHQLAYADDEQQALEATDEFMQSYACLAAAGLEAGAVMAELRARTTDTQARLEAYFRYNRRVSGAYLKLPSTELTRCSFDLAGLAP